MFKMGVKNLSDGMLYLHITDEQTEMRTKLVELLSERSTQVSEIPAGCQRYCTWHMNELLTQRTDVEPLTLC